MSLNESPTMMSLAKRIFKNKKNKKIKMSLMNLTLSPDKQAIKTFSPGEQAILTLSPNKQAIVTVA